MGNAGRLDLYFLAVAAMSTANTALFLWPVASRYAYIPPGAEGFGSSDDGSVVGKGKGGPAERAPSPFRLALPLSTAMVDPDALPPWSRATSRAGSSEGSAHGGSATLARLQSALPQALLQELWAALPDAERRALAGAAAARG